MKTSIMKAILFQHISFQEDLDFATRLTNSGLIKTEYSHSILQYNYYCEAVNVKFIKQNGIYLQIDVKYNDNQNLNLPPAKVGIRTKNGRLSLR